MFIPDPGSWFFTHPGSRIPDLGSQISDPGSKNSNKREGWKKLVVKPFFCSHKFHKIENYFIFEMLKKIFWANFQRIMKLFTQKIVNKLSKIWAWDPGSGKNLLRIPDPGVKVKNKYDWTPPFSLRGWAWREAWRCCWVAGALSPPAVGTSRSCSNASGGSRCSPGFWKSPAKQKAP